MTDLSQKERSVADLIARSRAVLEESRVQRARLARGIEQFHMLAFGPGRRDGAGGQRQASTIPDDSPLHLACIDPDGSIQLPPTLLAKTQWKPGLLVLLEQTDEGLLVTEMEVPGARPDS